ncbi:MAG TPA: hypothetical protein ENJ08_00540 [Gammaproteobacteria bacterium]|nr:hypothetical protein [Gammaproteobacteria bacterium]
MDAYKTPDSNVNTTYQRPFKPVKAVLLGLFVSVILLIIVSMIFAVLFGIGIGVGFDNVDDFEKLIVTNVPFLLIDFLLSAATCYFSGIVVGKNAPGKEYKYAIIVALITSVIFLVINITGETGDLYPLWLEILNYLIVPVAIVVGARSTIAPPTK